MYYNEVLIGESNFKLNGRHRINYEAWFVHPLKIKVVWEISTWSIVQNNLQSITEQFFSQRKINFNWYKFHVVGVTYSIVHVHCFYFVFLRFLVRMCVCGLLRDGSFSRYLPLPHVSQFPLSKVSDHTLILPTRKKVSCKNVKISTDRLARIYNSGGRVDQFTGDFPDVRCPIFLNFLFKSIWPDFSFTGLYQTNCF